jgi:hypothetical protein
MQKHIVDYVNYGFHLAAIGITLGLIVAVVRAVRRAR